MSTEILQGLFSSPSPKYREIFIRKYRIVQKIDHLACNAIQGLKRILILPVNEFIEGRRK